MARIASERRIPQKESCLYWVVMGEEGEESFVDEVGGRENAASVGFRSNWSESRPTDEGIKSKSFPFFQIIVQGLVWKGWKEIFSSAFSLSKKKDSLGEKHETCSNSLIPFSCPTPENLSETKNVRSLTALLCSKKSSADLTLLSDLPKYLFSIQLLSLQSTHFLFLSTSRFFCPKDTLEKESEPILVPLFIQFNLFLKLLTSSTLLLSSPSFCLNNKANIPS